MALDIPGGLFQQRDVRETPVSTATATAVGLTEPLYLTLATYADLVNERVLTAGAGIDFTDNGAGGTLVINGEAASTTNPGIIEVATGGETNTGTSATLAVSPDALDDWTGSAQLLHTNITAGDGSDHADVATNTTHISSDGSDHSLLANKTSYLSIPGNAFRANFPDTGNIFISDNAPYVKAQANDIGLVCPVMLPHGAVVTEVIVEGNAGAEAGETWIMYREEIATGGVGESMANASIGTADSTITGGTIDNSTYVYFITTSTIDTDDEIFGAKITYTTDYV